MKLLTLQHALLLDGNRDVAYARERAVDSEAAFAVLRCEATARSKAHWYVRPLERILAALRGANDEDSLIELLALTVDNASPVSRNGAVEPVVPTVMLANERFVGICLPSKRAAALDRAAMEPGARSKGGRAEGVTATYHDGAWWYLSAHDEVPAAAHGESRRSGAVRPNSDAVGGDARDAADRRTSRAGSHT